MGGVFCEVATVGVNDDMVGTALLVEPAGEGDDAALGSAELIDLGHDDGPGAGGDGLHGPLKEILSQLIKWPSDGGWLGRFDILERTGSEANRQKDLK